MNLDVATVLARAQAAIARAKRLTTACDDEQPDELQCAVSPSAACDCDETSPCSSDTHSCPLALQQPPGCSHALGTDSRALPLQAINQVACSPNVHGHACAQFSTSQPQPRGDSSSGGRQAPADSSSSSASSRWSQYLAAKYPDMTAAIEGVTCRYGAAADSAAADAAQGSHNPSISAPGSHSYRASSGEAVSSEMRGNLAMPAARGSHASAQGGEEAEGGWSLGNGPVPGPSGRRAIAGGPAISEAYYSLLRGGLVNPPSSSLPSQQADAGSRRTPELRAPSFPAPLEAVTTAGGGSVGDRPYVGSPPIRSQFEGSQLPSGSLTYSRHDSVGGGNKPATPSSHAATVAGAAPCQPPPSCSVDSGQSGAEHLPLPMQQADQQPAEPPTDVSASSTECLRRAQDVAANTAQHLNCIAGRLTTLHQQQESTMRSLLSLRVEQARLRKQQLTALSGND